MIEYNVSIGRRNEHLFSFIMKFIVPMENPRIQMASWTPGSYLIRDYARNVQELKAEISSKPAQLIQESKNTWMILADKGSELSIEYYVYGLKLTVRTNYLDNRKGLLIGCNSFFYLLDRDGEPSQAESSLVVDLPSGWKTFTSLRQFDGKYLAENLDELLDSPIAFAVDELVDSKNYDYNGIPCTIAVFGDQGNHDINVLESDLRKLQDQSVKFFNELPYDRYFWILFVVDKGGGGLEHMYSNVSITNRFNFSDPKLYSEKVLRLESHEHFHVYNVKRIRPKPLGPFDYANEVYTTGLWIAEGITNFYESIFLLREGIIDLKTYFDWKTEDIKRYYSTPGRKLSSLAFSSFNAWTKLYKSDENTVNSYVSYYLKGGLVGFLLNVHIIKNSNGKYSLDNVYRYLWTRYKLDMSLGYDEDEFAEIIKQITGVDCSEFFQKYVYGTDELPFQSYFKYLGVNYTLKEEERNGLDGVVLDGNVVKNVLSSSSWIDSALTPKDKIIALNRYEVTGLESIKKILTGLKNGSKLIAHVIRDGILLELTGVVNKQIKVPEISIDKDVDEATALYRKKIFEGQ